VPTLGTKPSFGNPKMSRYIYCARNRSFTHRISCRPPSAMNNATNGPAVASRAGKRFLFVGTKKQASEVIALEAARLRCLLREPALAGRHAHQLGAHRPRIESAQGS